MLSLRRLCIVVVAAVLTVQAGAAPPVTAQVLDACGQTFQLTCRIISEMRDRNEIDDEMRLHLIRWAYQEYLACRAKPARLPYSERRGD